MSGRADPIDPGDERPLSALIEDLRRLERRRTEATPGSSEYMEVVRVERELVDQIREHVDSLDSGPYWLGRG